MPRTTDHTSRVLPCGHVHAEWPRPAACDPEPDRAAAPGAWWAWRHRELTRIPAGQLI